MLSWKCMMFSNGIVYITEMVNTSLYCTEIVCLSYNTYRKKYNTYSTSHCSKENKIIANAHSKQVIDTDSCICLLPRYLWCVRLGMWFCFHVLATILLLTICLSLTFQQSWDEAIISFDLKLCTYP